MDGTNILADYSFSTFLDLINEAKVVKDLKDNDLAQKLRIVLLSDFTNDYLKSLLEVFLRRNQVQVEILTPSYGAIETVVYNHDSDIYLYKPDVIIIIFSDQNLRSGYYNCGIDKKVYEQYTLKKILSIWSAIQSQCSAKIIQSNFVGTVERLFGNFDLQSSQSLANVTASLNYNLVENIKKHSHVSLLDLNYLASYIGKEKWFDETQWFNNKIFCSLNALPIVAKNLSDICVSLFVRTIKCIVLDLDNTLWGGIIGDDGPQGIVLSPDGEGEVFMEFQSYLLELKNRGIILAISSKNNHSTALDVFRNHPYMRIKEDDISVFCINWNNKADNIKTIKEVLNISYDSIVFFDDSPFERKLVANYLPEIIIPDLPSNPADYINEITKYNLFESSSSTKEDSVRTKMYQQENKRNKLRDHFDNVDDYLKTLEMESFIARFNLGDLDRITQLTHRSNQFNLTTKRYNSAQIEAMIENDNISPFSIFLKDKWGEYGLISAVILEIKGDCIYIDQWLMSCRVLSRGVESFVMNYIFNFAKKKKIKTIIGSYVPTKKNSMVKTFYEKFKFVSNQNPNYPADTWEMSVNNYIQAKEYIKLSSSL